MLRNIFVRKVNILNSICAWELDWQMDGLEKSCQVSLTHYIDVSYMPDHELGHHYLN